jgi:hypothetical protein
MQNPTQRQQILHSDVRENIAHIELGKFLGPAAGPSRQRCKKL